MKYFYKCRNCREVFEIVRPITEVIKNGKHKGVRCLKCKSPKVYKVISAPSILFKGSGWGKDK